ncbi:MAG TPA: SRPBCC domain-containing protein, partial [Rhodocyclaceae bacterium]|nr:SRPBCC domain-containing protein [Rhodocyclaceae bacterium]
MNTFSTRRFFSAPPAAVFAAIQDGERLARWWGPAGFANRFAVFEFRPQGRWIFTMVGPDGREYPNESVFASVVPDRLVVIRHVCAPHFQLTIALEAEGSGTLLRWPLDEAPGLLEGGDYTTATEAWVAQQDKVQGAASRDGMWWLSCSS